MNKEKYLNGYRLIREAIKNICDRCKNRLATYQLNSVFVNDRPALICRKCHQLYTDMDLQRWDKFREKEQIIERNYRESMDCLNLERDADRKIMEKKFMECL